MPRVVVGTHSPTSPNDNLPWSDADDRKLVDAVLQRGNTWAEIAAKCGIGRSGNACRIHFHSHIRRSSQYKHCKFFTPRSFYNMPVCKGEFPDPGGATEVAAFNDFFAEKGLPVDEPFIDPIIDEYSFESIISLGAQPHAAQPVVPSCVDALTTNGSFWPEPTTQPSAPAHQSVAPARFGTIRYRSVSQVTRHNGTTIVKSTFRHAGTVLNIHHDLAKINSVVSTPMAKAQVKRTARCVLVRSGIVFNATLVSSRS